jgi:hypothetical protein
MKTKKILLPCIAAVAIATFVGAKSFKTSASESNELLLANVEALTNPPEGDGQFPKYKNKTTIKTYSEVKFEYGTDENGKNVKFEYKRNCTTLFTYCKYTGQKGDICYERLNGKVTDCDTWQRS